LRRFRTQSPTSTRIARTQNIKDRPNWAVFFCLKFLFNRPMDNGDDLLVDSDDFKWREDDLRLPFSDRGLAYGHGVFESMLYSDGRIALEDLHLDRLIIGAQRLGISVSRTKVVLSLNSFCARLVLEQRDSCVIKLILTAGSGGRGYINPDEMNPRLIVIDSPTPDDLDEQRTAGISLWRCSSQLSVNPQLAGIKHLNRLEQVLARNELHRQDCSDGLMFDYSGCLIETTSANVFVKTRSAGWITPSLLNAGVAGVMRSIMINTLFPSLNIALEVRSVHETEVAEIEEIFVCNSIRGILPVNGVASRDNVMANYAIGSVTRDLQTMLCRLYPCFA
jgi:4-amino-4-deoxychorismate lyase